MTDMERLQLVADHVRQVETARETFRKAAELMVEQQLESYNADLDRAVLAALDAGHSVTDVARAYTISGRTPNRNAIHAIKRAYSDDGSMTLSEYPFEWVERRIATVTGTRTVYDIVGSLIQYGPDEVTGEYRWTYNQNKGELDPVITEADPYPADKFYTQAIQRWIMNNPYPKGE